jgi:hypothetical protein
MRSTPSAQILELPVMTLRIQILVVACVLLGSAAHCPAQDLEKVPDSTLTADQWQQRVRDARRRSEEFVTNARTQTTSPLTSEKEDAEAADQRALNDPSLQRGDIVSTSQGFVVFVGRDSEQRQPGDFLPAAKSPVSTAKSPPNSER